MKKATVWGKQSRVSGLPFALSLEANLLAPYPFVIVAEGLVAKFGTVHLELRKPAAKYIAPEVTTNNWSRCMTKVGGPLAPDVLLPQNCLLCVGRDLGGPVLLLWSITS